MIEIPPALSWWRQRPGGGDWLDRLPRLVSECTELWDLRVGPAYRSAHVSFVAPVELEEGTPAVLKVNFPGVELDTEADALAHWDGRGAVRLLERDRDRSALLLERCEPGTPLWTVGDDAEAMGIAAGVLRRLWRPAPAAHPFPLLAGVAERWAEAIPRDWAELGRPFERGLVDEAVLFLREHGPVQGETIVLHHDFHSGNVLRAGRESWLAIDPQPLAGERAFDAASLLRDRPTELVRDPAPRERLARRLDLLAEELAIDRELLRRWGLVHALAWGVSAPAKKVEPELVECARLLASG